MSHRDVILSDELLQQCLREDRCLVFSAGESGSVMERETLENDTLTLCRKTYVLSNFMARRKHSLIITELTTMTRYFEYLISEDRDVC